MSKHVLWVLLLGGCATVPPAKPVARGPYGVCQAEAETVLRSFGAREPVTTSHATGGHQLIYQRKLPTGKFEQISYAFRELRTGCDVQVSTTVF